MSGRPANPRKAELLKLLGLDGTKRNWTLSDLEKKYARKQEKEAKNSDIAKIAGDEPLEEKFVVPDDFRDTLKKDDPFGGLTEQQKLIARLKLRGLSQGAIAQVVKITQGMVSKELAAIKVYQETKGAGLEQAGIIGETSSIYEEVEFQAWGVYYNTPQDSPEAKLKALETVMKARNAHTKILMDVGLVKKAGAEIKHTHEVLSPFLKKFEEAKELKKLGDGIVSDQLGALPAPEPDNIVEAEIIENPTDNEIEYEIKENNSTSN